MDTWTLSVPQTSLESQANSVSDREASCADGPCPGRYDAGIYFGDVSQGFEFVEFAVFHFLNFGTECSKAAG